MANIGKALGSFEGFRGAQIPTDPTNQSGLDALVNAVDGGSCWSGEAPTWLQVETKVAEYDAEDQAKVDTEVARLQSVFNAQEYARNRKLEYPSIEELIVALWENVVEERSASVVSLEFKRQEIKTKYPK